MRVKIYAILTADSLELPYQRLVLSSSDASILVIDETGHGKVLNQMLRPRSLNAVHHDVSEPNRMKHVSHSTRFWIPCWERPSQVTVSEPKIINSLASISVITVNDFQYHWVAIILSSCLFNKTSDILYLMEKRYKRGETGD